MENNRPKVGIGVMVMKDGKVLYAQRRGAHGEGEYSFLGGHMEHMESFEDCARREVKEECGIEIDNVRFLCVSNLKQYSPKHYVDIGILADWKSGDPVITEKDRFIGEWGWCEIDHLPEPLFGPIYNYIESYETGKKYFDA